MIIDDERLILTNAHYFSENSFKKGSIAIRNGIIVKIAESFYKDELMKASKVIDCSNLYIVPGFIDSHLHLPGDYLYRYFGLNLTDKYSFNEYYDRIKDSKLKQYSIIRGYGWNHDIMGANGFDGYREIKKLIDKIYDDKLFILYSDDYHSCICNQKLLKRYVTIREYEYSLDEVGLLEEEDIFEIQKQFPELSFSSNEIRSAILKYQDMLLSQGITSVQTLMFLGGDNKKEWEILKDLDAENQLFINVNLALTIHSNEILEYILCNLNRLKTFASNKIKMNTIKIYIDGVVENQTAYISEPYENTFNVGDSLWEENKLLEICQYVDENNMQIHAHAIGDSAVHLITKALTNAMDINKTKGKNRHVITHLQMVQNEDIKLMGEYGIIANIQPYWIPIDDFYYPIDVKNIGERVKDEYKVNSFLKNKVIVTASSDSPVTQNPYPILGMSNAIFRSNINEKANWTDMLNAFTINGAFQLGRELEIGLIKEGYKADLTLLSNDLNMNNRNEFENIKVVMTLSNGIIRYNNL